MAAPTREPLEYYLGLEYSFNVLADPDGGYVVVFPDLPGCLTQVERLDELPALAEEARTLWIETEYERGADIPLPSYREEYSGKLNLRLPRSLHRSLAEAAERNGIRLNQYLVYLLARRRAGADRAAAGRSPGPGRRPEQESLLSNCRPPHREVLILGGSADRTGAYGVQPLQTFKPRDCYAELLLKWQEALVAAR